MEKAAVKVGDGKLLDEHIPDAHGKFSGSVIERRNDYDQHHVAVLMSAAGILKPDA